MGWFASERDRIVTIAIERWKEIAEQEIDDIGGWREHHTEKRFPQAPFSNGEPQFFFGNTATIVSFIASELPSLDPTPLQDIYAAVKVWYDDWNADRIPAQNELDLTLAKAMMLLNIALDRIFARTVNTRPGSAAGGKKPTAPPAPDTLTPGQQDIWTVVVEAGHRMTQAEIMRALSEKFPDAEPSPSMTKAHLAVLSKQLGILPNRSDKRPPGYGLPDWD